MKKILVSLPDGVVDIIDKLFPSLGRGIRIPSAI